MRRSAGSGGRGSFQGTPVGCEVGRGCHGVAAGGQSVPAPGHFARSPGGQVVGAASIRRASSRPGSQGAAAAGRCAARQLRAAKAPATRCQVTRTHAARNVVVIAADDPSASSSTPPIKHPNRRLLFLCLSPRFAPLMVHASICYPSPPILGSIRAPARSVPVFRSGPHLDVGGDGGDERRRAATNSIFTGSSIRLEVSYPKEMKQAKLSVQLGLAGWFCNCQIMNWKTLPAKIARTAQGLQMCYCQT